MPTMASLCSGAGMLDRELQKLFGLDVAYHAETDRAASQVLEFRWPGVPNLGDITAIGGPHGWPRRHLNAPRRARRSARMFDRRVRAWREQVPTVDLVAAGFPCQPFSSSGRRSGSSDERHLWPTGVLPAIEALLPPVVVLENVPNLLPIESGGVFGRVLADLDRLGYTVAWTVVGACKVGACHHRHRLFVLAVRSGDVRVPSSDPVAGRHGDRWLPVQQVLFGDAQAVRWSASGVSRGGAVWPLPVETCGDNGVVLLPTPRVSAMRTGRSAILGSASSPSLEQALELARGEVPRELRSLDEAPESWQLLPTPTSRIADRWGTPSVATAQARMESGRRNLEDAVALLPLLPTPRATDTGTPGRRSREDFRPPLSQVILPMFPGLAASDARGVGSNSTPRASDAVKGGPNQRGSSGDLMLPSAVQPGRFGKYEPAVRRHELAFGLPVPHPTEPGRTGNPRLAAAFPEWMMALPSGWVTDVVGRNDALRIAGNGVFGPVVTYALRTLPTFPAAVALLAGARLAVAA